MRSEPVHHAILVLDIEGFGQTSRTNSQRAQLRERLHALLDDALATAEITPDEVAARSDFGDGILLLFDPTVSTAVVLHPLLSHLANRLANADQILTGPERLRLRAAVHEGYVLADRHGYTGDDLNYAFRLLDSNELRAYLAASTAPLALIVSDKVYEKVYESVVQQAWGDLKPQSYRRVLVMTKQEEIRAWVATPVVPSDHVSVPRGRHVFISHSAQRRGQAQRLSDALRARGYIVVGKSAEAAEDELVERELAEADLFLLLLGEETVGGWQSREMMAALESYWAAPNKRIVVIADRDAKIPAVLRQNAMLLSEGTPADWAAALDDTERWFAQYEDKRRADQPVASYQDRIERVGQTATRSSLAIGELTDSRQHLQRQLAGQAERLGWQHPETADTLHRLGMTSQELGDLAEARSLLERAFRVRTQVLGPDHPATAASAHSLGLVALQLGDLAEARSLFTRAYEANARTLGADAPETLEAREALRAAR